MPEGPEVLAYYNFIKPILKDKVLVSFDILSGKYIHKKEIKNYENTKIQRKDKKIIDVKVKGKTIFICLENEMGFIFTHGMTGYWSKTEEKHARIKFDLDDLTCKCKTELYYIDPRNFGTVSVYSCKEEFEEQMSKLGPDVLDKNITYDIFFSRLNKKPRSKIAIALLDQNVICGIGNYLRCDILWYAENETEIKNEKRAYVFGETRIKDLSEEEKKNIYDAAINICRYYASLPYKLKFTPEGSGDGRYHYIYMEDREIMNEYTLHREVKCKKLNGRTFHYTI